MPWKTIIAVGLFFAVLILGLIWYVKGENENPDPEFQGPAMKHIRRAYDDSALAAGRAGVYAQRLAKSFDNKFATSLAELRAIDKNVDTDPDVIFVFGNVDERGFTFTTSHKKGTKSFVFK
jgi:hypothetical protein